MSAERIRIMIWAATVIACFSFGLSLAAIGLTCAIIAQ